MKVFFLAFCIFSGGDCPVQSGFMITKEACERVRDRMKESVDDSNYQFVILTDCEPGVAPDTETNETSD